MYDLLFWLDSLAISRFVQQSQWAFPTIESFHVIAVAVVFGTIALVDLRLLGLASKSRRYTDVANASLRWTWIAFALAVVTGTLMFLGNAVEYYENTWFRIKFMLLLLAGLNMLYFQIVTVKTASKWDADIGKIPPAAKLAGALSLLFWFGVIVAGRWVGFTLFQLPF